RLLTGARRRGGRLLGRRGGLGLGAGRLLLGGGLRPRRALLAGTATAPLLGDAGDVGQQRHLAGVLDRPGDGPLLLGVVAGDAAGADLRPVGHEPAQQVDVLPVDVLDALGDQDAGLLLGPAGVVLVLRAGLGR